MEVVEHEDQDDRYQHVGSVDENGQPHGRGTLYFQSGDRFEGKFKRGNKQGKGCFYFEDGSTLQGVFVDDAVTGTGVYTFADGSCMVGCYTDGNLNGLVKEFYANGKLQSKAFYINNRKNGFVYYFDEYGSCLFGKVNNEGQLSGDGIAYVYPDKQTSLIGKFKDGELISACLGVTKNVNHHCYQVNLDPKCKQIIFRKDIATKYKISSHDPLLKDPFEEKRVYVDMSKITSAGEGLFAKMCFEEDEVVAFYNGIKLSHEEVNNREWHLNNNTISLDENTVIDVPSKYSSLTIYCASLGHKANHSFEPNCKYSLFQHPYFGKIKCICTIKSVQANEELTVAYGYDHNGLGRNEADAPQWYKDSLKKRE